MLHRYSGEKLRVLRDRSHLSQRQVERCTGVAKSTLHYLEKGLQKPQTRTLERLLRVYADRIRAIEGREKLFWETSEDP